MTSAAGNTSAPNPEHPEPLESDGRSVGVPRAHRNLEELLESCGRVKMSAGHGEALTAALRPGLEKNRKVGGYKRLELALRGANYC